MNIYAKLTGSVLAGALALAVTSANALTVRISDSNANTLTINDGDAADLAVGVDGSLIASGLTLGGSTLSIATAFVLDETGKASLELNVTNANASGATLFIDATHTGFTGGAVAPAFTSLSFAMNASNISGGNVVGFGAFDDADAPFAGSVIGSSGVITSTGDSILEGASAALTPTFSLSIFTDVLDGATTSFDATVTAAVPVPAALPLFASALLGLAMLGRRRSKA